MKDIYDIFDEVGHCDVSDEYASGLSVVQHSFTDTECARIGSLSEVFLEWYLFDSSCQKDINQFLEIENIQDIFTEQEYMDLICGSAYLDAELVQFIAMKLPFGLSPERLRALNSFVADTKPQAYAIRPKGEIADQIANKVSELVALKKQKRQEHDRQYYQNNSERIKKQKHEYYLSHKAAIRESNKRWIMAHIEQYRAYQAQYRLEHIDEAHEYHAQYRKENATIVSERKKKCYRAKKAQYRAHAKKYYEENKEALLQHQKQYYEENKERISERGKKYYEAHKPEISLRNKRIAAEKREQANTAKKMCAVYLYLLYLRRNNKAVFTEIYKPRQDFLKDMMKTCVALQQGDYKLCPLLNGAIESQDAHEKCGCPRAFLLPGAMDSIRKYIQELLLIAR